MRVITKYVSASGAQISADWWAADDGTRYLVRALSDEQRQALGITTTTEQIPDPPAPSLEQVKAARIAAINFECRSRITATWPIEKQLSALAGVYGPTELQAMTDWVDAHIAASNTASDAIDAATTTASVEAVTVAWPV